MNDYFIGKNAVITGAACGIGKAIAKRCARNQMNIMLADVDSNALASTKDELEQINTNISIDSLVVDVSNPVDVENLAKRSVEKFTNIHYLFNNAGVSIGGSIWEFTLKDWQWVLGVNMWGVIHSVRSFVPRLIAQDQAAHIINTASLSGFTCPPEIGIYNLSKHGVVSISETLQHELEIAGHNVQVSVLIPDFVNTEIMESKRNRPKHLKNETDQELSEEERGKWREAVSKGMSPDEVANITFEAIQENKFYIFTHHTSIDDIKSRFSRIIQGSPPSNPFEHIWKEDSIEKIQSV